MLYHCGVVMSFVNNSSTNNYITLFVFVGLHLPACWSARCLEVDDHVRRCVLYLPVHTAKRIIIKVEK